LSIATAVVSLDKLPSGDGLSISLHDGGIAFGGDCDTTTGTWVRPGTDNKVFHLDRTLEAVCKTLEKKQLGGWTTSRKMTTRFKAGDCPAKFTSARRFI
jgi:hypothetical protein